MRHLIRAWLLVLLAAAWPPAVLAQTYPNRPVRVVYPFPPGGGDSVVRLFCERLSQALGQPVVLDHRGGAGGVGVAVSFPHAASAAAPFATSPAAAW